MFSRSRLFLMVCLCSLLLVSVSMVGAQATPVPMTADDLITGGSTLMNTFGLFALVTVAAFIGIAAMIVRRMRRAAM